MTDERTPLIQTVVIAPPRRRYRHDILRRFCTILFTCTLITALVLFALAIGSTSNLRRPGRHHHHRHHEPHHAWLTSLPSKSWPQSNGLSYKDLQEIVLSTPDESKVREWSRYYTAGPHLAGKNLSQAIWTKDRWQEFGVVDTSIVAYDVYVNYPLGHRLALLEQENQKDLLKAKNPSFKIKYEAKLEEDVLEEDPTTGLTERVPTFHGYSASGNVTAQYVYVNYGTYQDFEDLCTANVSLNGKIALIKYGGIFRGLKIKRASELGMIGAIIYSDPGDDGEVTEENGDDPYPTGPARNPSSVQRGSAQYLSVAPGDPTTPGYPSNPGAPRKSVKGSIPDIPSIPISYVDALPLLKALNGHGPNATSFNKYWHTGGLGNEGVHYNIGPSPPNLTLNLVNEQEYVTTPMWDVIGIINGTVPDEVVILGNHRDAWIAGGAGDPNSGSAAFNEVIRGLGIALKAGWKPLRTIVLASWDGEEYGLIGSTEWVEEYLPWLSASAIAYLNVDVGTSGPEFTAAAAPLLDKSLIEITNMVQSPNQTVKGQTVNDLWSGHINTMGSGSDFTAFQDYAGIPCVDMGFKPNQRSAIYHYHSNYDSFAWMDRYGDPGWHYHTTIAKMWALLAIKIVETPVIPFNATDYAKGLNKYLDSVKEKARKSDLGMHATGFNNLTTAIVHLHNVSIDIDASADKLMEEIRDSDGLPWYKWWMKIRLYLKVRALNNKYKFLERQFLYAKGLDSRSWFKHTVFAPGLWTGYAGATFPGLVEALDANDEEGIEKWEEIITQAVYNAVKLLQ